MANSDKGVATIDFGSPTADMPTNADFAGGSTGWSITDSNNLVTFAAGLLQFGPSAAGGVASVFQTFATRKGISAIFKHVVTNFISPSGGAAYAVTLQLGDELTGLTTYYTGAVTGNGTFVFEIPAYRVLKYAKIIFDFTCAAPTPDGYFVDQASFIQPTSKSSTLLAITGQTGLTDSAHIEAFMMGDSTTDHSADEHIIESIKLRCGSIVPGVGFTIYAETEYGGTFGQFKVRWVWLNTPLNIYLSDSRFAMDSVTINKV